MKGAALPSGKYSRPATMLGDGNSISVTVYAETGHGSKDFQFHKMKLGPELENAFAEGFERATGPGGTRRTLESAENLYRGLRAFAGLLNALPSPPRKLSDLRPAHIASVRLRGTRSSLGIVHAVRTTLRANESLPGPFRELLYAPLSHAPAGPSVASYSDSEFRAIRRAARTEIRAALARIRAGEAELAAWLKAPELKQGTTENVARGALLAKIARDGTMSYSEGKPGSQYAENPNADSLVRALFPSISELAALLVLLQCVTGQNLSTLCNLTTDFLRADNQNDEDEVLLARAQKPRRGRYSAEMDFPLTSVPVWLDTESDTGGDDFASPFGVYMIAEELCRRARSFTATNLLLCWAYRDQWNKSATGGIIFRPISKGCLRRWRGWTHDGKLQSTIDSRRLRRTFLQHHQRPVAQTGETLANTYLSKDPATLSTNQEVVGSALAEEVTRIRVASVIRVLSDDDVRAASNNPKPLAEQLGISLERLADLLDGRLDTVAAACIDHEHGPHSPDGAPCTASFLLCLGCSNARSEPRHIPVQALLWQRIEARRLELPAKQWERRFGVAEERLDDLLCAQRADVKTMAAQATDRDLQMIEALLDGKYDLR